MAGTDAIRSAMASRNYRNYAIGSFASHVGTWVQRVAVGWLAWELTHSGLWLGMIAFADLAPTVFLAPVCGVVADRVDRLHGSRVTQSLAALQAFSLWGMAIAGWLTIEWLFCLVLVQGVIMAFNQPLRFAIIPSLVEHKDLGSAIAINSISFNFARVAGPALAGIIIAQSGTATAFLINSVTYVLFIVSLFSINPRFAAARRRKAAARRCRLKYWRAYNTASANPASGPCLSCSESMRSSGGPIRNCCRNSPTRCSSTGWPGFPC